MSSGTRSEPNKIRDLVKSYEQYQTPNISRMGLSNRQLKLNHLWSYYKCEQYDTRTVDWDGNKVVGYKERATISTAGYVPPGFVDQAGDMLPLKFRRPTVQYHLAKVIVDRFTGLLFSAKRHPKIGVETDPKTEEWITSLADVARLWPAMIQARTYGGAMGSACVGFQFVEGKPFIEVHDPRWVIPEFYDRHNLKLRRIDKRYQYPVEVPDYETGEWVTVKMWYRRVIDDKRDIIFKPVPVSRQEDPVWEPQHEVEHNFGFCPAVWIQNLPVTGSIDGEPDCHGILELTEEIDALHSQAKVGVMNNCDPTTVITTDAAMDDVRKGSYNALKLPSGSSAQYLELNGSGPAAAREQAGELRALALEISQCVLEHPDVANRTATEIEKTYSSMLSKADVLREQYGEKGVKPLSDMIIRAAAKLAQPVRSDNEIVRRTVILPPKVEEDEEGNKNIVKRELGPGPYIVQLGWGEYFEPNLQDANTAVQATSTANQSGLIDKEHAIKKVATYFDVEDIPAMMKKIEEEQAAAQEQMMAGMMGGMMGGGEGDEDFAEDEEF